MTTSSPRIGGRTSPYARTAGLKKLSALTAALALGSVVGTGVIAADLVRHIGTTSTTSTTGTSSGTTSGTTNRSTNDDGGSGDDGSNGFGILGGSSQGGTQSGSSGTGGSLSGGSGSSHATSGGS